MKNNIVLGAFSALTIFFLFSVAATAVTAWAPSSFAARAFSVVFPDQVISEIRRAQQNSSRLPAWWLITVQKLHSGNAATVRELGVYEAKQSNVATTLTLLQRAIQLDPKNLTNHIAYIESRDNTSQPLTFTDEISLLSGAYLDRMVFRNMVRGLSQHPPNLNTIIGAKRLDVNRIRSDSVITILARSFYLYGASVRDKDPAGAVYWWGLAGEADPGVSYYAVSESDMLSGVLRDNIAAKEALMLCMTNIHARPHCQQALTRLKDGWVAPIGYYDGLIIPNIPLQ